MLAPKPHESPTFGIHLRQDEPQPSASSQPDAPLPLQPQEQQQKRSTWRGRKFFSRRVQSMQPPVRAVDDGALKRSVSEYKQFDGWPFGGSGGGGSGGGSSAAQRFSLPGLGAIPPLRARQSSDSAPPS